MTRIILTKITGAALALIVVAGFAGHASAGLREYCDSYARDVANRKTNGGSDVGGLVGHGKGAGTGAIIGGVGGTVLGAGVTSDRYKRVYANAYGRCVDNYEGTRAQSAPNEDRVTVDKAEKAAAETSAPEKVVDDKTADQKVVDEKPVDEKAVTTKKVKVAENDTADGNGGSAESRAKACARKYRSFDAQVGKYKSYTGKWRPCRL